MMRCVALYEEAGRCRSKWLQLPKKVGEDAARNRFRKSDVTPRHDANNSAAAACFTKWQQVVSVLCYNVIRVYMSGSICS